MNVDTPIDQLSRFFVDDPVRGEQHVARELTGSPDEHRDGLAIVICEVRQAEEPRDVEDLVEEQLDIAIIDQRVGRGLHEALHNVVEATVTFCRSCLCLLNDRYQDADLD